MTAVPTSVTVIGSGAGGLASAADISLQGVPVTLADLPEFSANVDAVASSGRITLMNPWYGQVEAPIADASTDPATATEAAELIVISVPAFGHRTFADLLAPALTAGQRVLWIGEGGGSLEMANALRRIGRQPEIEIGETNSLPYGARVRGPGSVSASKKKGGTVVAALGDHSGVIDAARALWPWVTEGDSVWETILLNFNAIDHVPPIVCNLGVIESRTGKMLLWGEGASPSVARVIEAVDAELLALRSALGVANRKRYADYLVEQGFAPAGMPDLFSTLQASSFSDSTFPCGKEALQSRYITEDVPYGLVFFSSLGHQVGVPTPTIDGLIQIVSIALDQDLRAEGRTLATFDLDGTSRDDLVRVAEFGWW